MRKTKKMDWYDRMRDRILKKYKANTRINDILIDECLVNIGYSRKEINKIIKDKNEQN